MALAAGYNGSVNFKAGYAVYLDEIHIHFALGCKNWVQVTIYKGPDGDVYDENLFSSSISLGATYLTGEDEDINLEDLKIWVDENEYITVGVNNTDVNAGHTITSTLVLKRIVNEVTG